MRSLIIGCLLVAPNVALAGGYYTLDSGIRAIGRGMAFTAGADDLSAQYYNPAALTRIDRTTLELQLAAASQLVVFDREDDLTGTYDPVKNQALPFPIPNFAVGTDFGVDGFALAVGLYTPFAPAYDYPDDGAQRYALIDATMIQATFGPSVAYRVGTVSFGAGVGYSLLQINQSLATSVSFDPTDDPAYDVRFDVAVQDNFALAASAGVLWEPTDRVAVGASFVPPTKFKARGSLSGDFSENTLYIGDNSLGQVLTAPSASDDDVALDITMPMILRVGFLVRPTDALELEIDGVYQGWSSIQEFLVTDMVLSVETSGEEPLVVTDDVALPAEMVDAWSVRLGGEVDVGDRGAVRFGSFWETSAAPEKLRSVFVPDAMKVGLSTGGQWRASDRFTLDAGVIAAKSLQPTIDESILFQVSVDPISGRIGGGRTVGNGTFGFTSLAFGLGATLELGKKEVADLGQATPSPLPPAPR
jgi:long-chain fatty acid transport protein